MLDKLFYKTISPGLFRFVLAFIVVVFHSVSFLTIGHYAVYIFFILSGYWIFKMYKEKYTFYRKSYLVYIKSRLLRLIPVYWFVLLITLVLYSLVPHLHNKVQTHVPSIFTSIFFNFLLLGVAKQSFLFIVPVWSLDVELQFYIIAPILIMFFSNKKVAILVTIIFSIFSLFLIYTTSSLFEFSNIFIYLPYFLLGGVIYSFNLNYPKQVAKMGVFLIGFILLIHYSIPQLRTDYLLNKNANVFHFNYSETLNVIFTLLTIPFITNNVRQKVLDKKNDNILSSMSFVIYLLHWPLLQLYAISVTNVSGIKKMLHLFIFYFLCVLFSWLISKFVDSFFESKRRSWIKRKQLLIVEV